MKTYKFHVKIIQNDITICELQFERTVTAHMWARRAASDYVRSLNFPEDSWSNIPWMEEVATDKDEECSWISNPLASFCSRNQINEDGFFNWEHPQMSRDEVIELMMESIEEARHD